MNTHYAMSFRLVGRSVVACLVVAGVMFGGGRAWGADLPRYKLKVGQELTYRSAVVPDESNANQPASPQSTTIWVFTVVKQNSAGGWRVLFREKTSYRSGEMRHEGYFDLAPDGRIAENRTITEIANPTPLFPTLPLDEDALSGTWTSSFSIDDTQREFQAPDGPPALDDTTWTFAGDSRGVFSRIYLMSTDYEYEFDLDDGLVSKITGTFKQGWPESIAGRTTKTLIELIDQQELESPELTNLGAEMTRYFDVCAAYDDVIAAQDYAHIAETLEEAEALLKEAEGEFELPAVQAALKGKLKHHERVADYLHKAAKRFGKLLDQPSADWETTDLEGHPRSLADYKGKVVLLDFWYRGCGWCIRAMPQLKQLADDFPRDKVAVLGINNDQNLDDARFVIDKMGLNYETLRNGDHPNVIHNKYGIAGWPTLVILDGQGVVRHIHSGYSPTLRKDLGRKIRELLEE